MLYLQEKQFVNPIKECIRKNYQDIKSYNFNSQRKQRIIINSVSKIQKKVEYLNYLGLQVFEKNEKM